MYLSVDSQALLMAAPRSPLSDRALDLCCGCGVQGIVALKHYAKQLTFLDVNGRAMRFARFNVHLNGFEKQATFIEGDICDPVIQQDLVHRGPFDVVLANPPFVPNPDNVSTACGPLYSRGGPDGQCILKVVIEMCANQLLAPGGRLSIVATVPNAEGLAT